jgi:hypothetical protein
MLQVNLVGIYILREMAAEHMRDAWNIRRSVSWARHYNNLSRVVWIVLNLSLPAVNDEYFDTGLFSHCSAIITVFHLVIWPCALTFYTTQRKPGAFRAVTHMPAKRVQAFVSAGGPVKADIPLENSRISTVSKRSCMMLRRPCVCACRGCRSDSFFRCM